MTEVTAETVQRLRWHAGLVDAVGLEGTSVSGATAQIDGPSDQLDDAIADLFAVLGQLNRELNGTLPSQFGDKAEMVPRAVAYAVSEIARMLRESNPGSRDAWRVDSAWSAILAGDIDDLRRHVADEEAARGG